MTFSIVVVVSRGNENKSRREVFFECFKALVGQDYPKDLYEIVVVDSASGLTQSDWDRFKEMASQKMVNFTPLYQPPTPGVGSVNGAGFGTIFGGLGNLGPSRGRNLGWQAVSKGESKIKSEAIVFTDDDVLPPADWLSRLSEGLSRYPTAAGVGGLTLPPRRLISQNALAAYDEHLYNRYFLGHPADDFYASYKRDEHPVFSGNIAYRREVLETVGGFDESFLPFVSGEDGDLKERVLGRGGFLVYVPVTNTHLADFSFSRFQKQQESRGAGIIKFRQKHGLRSQTFLEVYLRLILAPFLWTFYFLETKNFKLTFLELLAYFFRQLGKIEYLSYLDSFSRRQTKKRIRILFSDHAPVLGGAQLALRRHLGSLNLSQFEPILAAGHRLLEINDQFRTIKDLKIIRFEFPKLKTTTLLLPIQLIISFLKFFQRVLGESPDLLVANTERAYYFCFLASLILQKKLILIVRDFEYSKTLLKLTAFKVDRFVCVSRAVESYYRLDAAKTKVVYVGSDLDERLKGVSSEAAADLKKSFAPSPSTVVVGFVGRLEVWKGVYLLLEAFGELVSSQAPDPTAELGWQVPLKLVFVGDGSQREALAEAAKREGLFRHVHFAGFVDDVEVWYKTFDIFVQASIEPEPFATTVIEAALARLPIVATATGGTAEFIEDNFNGLLVKPEVGQLKAAIFRLIENEDLRQSLRQNAYRKALADFTEEKVTAKLEEVYRVVAGYEP